MSAARQRRRQPELVEPPVIAGRVPPHDLDAEAAVLSACMLDGGALDVCLELLEPEDFYSEANSRIFEACRDVAKGGSPVDLITVVGWLRSRELIRKVGGAEYIGDIIDKTPAVANVEWHAKIVIAKKRLRVTIATCQKFAAEGYGDVVDATAFVGDLEAAVYGLADQRRGDRGFESLKDALAVAFGKINAAAESGSRITGTSTGLTDLDQKTAGMHDGDLIIVAARPSMGKTALVLNIAVNVAEAEVARFQAETAHGVQGSPPKIVSIFSFEMPKDQVSARMVCTEARVDLGKLRQGYLSQEDWANLTSAASALSQLPIQIDDTPGLTVMDMRGRLRRLRAEHRRVHGPDAQLGPVVVDYLQMMSAHGRHSNREQEIEEISRGLKQIAKEFNVPVIALAQLNRGVETRGGKDKRPMLSDLRNSGAIEQDADVVIFIYRDEYYNKEETNERGIAELIIAKQRNGPTGTVRVRFVASCTKFENLAPGEFESFEEFDQETRWR